MKKLILSLIFLPFLVQLAFAELIPAPRYSWTTFQRFWNVNSLSNLALADCSKMDSGYILSVTSTTSLTFHLNQEGLVTGVSAYFQASDLVAGGGRRFLDLMSYIINIGSYRWTEEKRNEVRKFFSRMMPQKRFYQWRNSLFTCYRLYNDDWEFSLDFIDAILE